MKIKNNLTGNVQFHFPIKKNGKDDVDYIHIPAGATVILADSVYAALLKPLTTVSLQTEVVSELESEADIMLDKKKVQVKDFVETGETKVVSLFREAIRRGDFTIVERPEIPKEQKLQLLAQNGVDGKSMSDEDINNLFDKLAG